MLKRFIVSIFNPPTIEEQLDLVRIDYGILPRETVEEADRALVAATKQLKAIIELSALVDRMEMKIRIADKKDDRKEAFKLRQLLSKRIAKAKKEGLL